MVYNNTFVPQLPNFNENSTLTNTTAKENTSYKREELTKYKLHLKKAKHFFKTDELIEAYHNYILAKSIASNILWYEAEAHCLMAIGTINTTWGKFDVAYKNYMECLNLVIDKDLSNSVSLIYFRLSDYYKKTNQPKLSKEYSEKAINSIKKTTLLE